MWIASAMTQDTRRVAEEAGRADRRGRAHGSSYRLRLVAHDERAYDWFYNVVSNPTLWFLQHYLWISSSGRTSTRASTTRGTRATSA